MDIDERLRLGILFPNLSSWSKTSEETGDYNCIAWAAGETDRWWWPDLMGISYWPDAVQRKATIEAFVSAFATLGYEICQEGTLENGWEKVAIFANELNRPTHACRQLENGFWTSKLGRDMDISHTVTCLDGDIYGLIATYMKRKR